MTLRETFSRLKKEGETALSVYVTAGDPDLENLPEIMNALVEGGADVIEVGMPFSDPIADGPTIQASSQRSLDRGTTPLSVLEQIRIASAPVPVVLMGYYNTILRMGLETFAERAVAAGVSGTIVCDVTPDQAGDWIGVSRKLGLDTIFLAAPTSTEPRIKLVAENSTGFVYAVSRTGVTGAAQANSGEIDALVGSIRAHTDLPVCVGFGIKGPDQARELRDRCDGVIVGSALVELLAASWQGGAGRADILAFVRGLKESLKTN